MNKDLVWEAAKRNVALYQSIVLEKEGWLVVGPFHQLTRFADVPPRFELASEPEQLDPERK
ncbi:hypothetical protein JQX13_50615 [Archangium violaceum]|uniref:hypothetical protein n=1 Tax=Archangium violaceum TaxID=83451 RepID=UPI00193BE6C3|nr:hypothetical protein [Archangium violaceum]QRK08118.1 hypothetical protein JQX13_50615 [Archangium violaceum]